MAIGVAVGLLLACTNNDETKITDNFRKDVIYCEEALAVLGSCCPGFDPKAVSCYYYYDSVDNGCGGGSLNYTYPALSQDESECILSTSCADLVANRVCERAQTAPAYSENQPAPNTQGSDEYSSHAPVCP